MFTVVLNEKILYKILILLSFTTDTHIQVIISDEKDDCQSNYYSQMANGPQNIKLMKIVKIVQIKPIGFY